MPKHFATPVTAGYSRAEWGVLTSLPGQVIVAATSVGPGRPRRGVMAGLAGLDGLAAGRSFDSDLVRAVVASIYAESTPPFEPSPALDVLATCRVAFQVLRRRADPADSAAYRQWVQSVAARVCRVGLDGVEAPANGDSLTAADQRFLARLGAALGLR